jgi:hypothetical protein
VPEYGPRPDHDTFRSWSGYCRYIKSVPAWRIMLSLATVILVLVVAGIRGDVLLLLLCAPATVAAGVTLFARWFGRSE